MQTIEHPDVSQRLSTYSQISFRRGDVVHVEAGGCVRHGKEWRPYTDHALVFVPGAMEKPVPVASVLGREIDVTKTPEPETLQLGYDDSDYSENGYGAREANAGPCNGPDAFVRVNIRHPLVSSRWAPVSAASATADPTPLRIALVLAAVAIAAVVLIFRRT